MNENFDGRGPSKNYRLSLETVSSTSSYIYIIVASFSKYSKFYQKITSLSKSDISIKDESKKILFLETSRIIVHIPVSNHVINRQSQL